MSAETIQIFLPSGDPRGIRIAEITTRIVQVIEVPRSLLDDFIEMEESSQVAVYFLVGAADAYGGRQVYIGQTDRLRDRMTAHNKSKEFWERALVLITATKSLTSTHAMYLEWHCIGEATKARRFAVENANKAVKPTTPRPLLTACLQIFETGRTLLATLGFPMFEPLAPAPGKHGREEHFYCTGSGADGRGLYTPEGFVVLQGSSGRLAVAPSHKGTAQERARKNLIDGGVLSEVGDRLVFKKDYAFGSPSSAATALMGRAVNGWIAWKLESGRTLHQVRRGGPRRQARKSRKHKQ